MKKTNHLLFVMTLMWILVMNEAALSQDWSQWRGANRDGKVTGFAAPELWSDQFTVKWSANVGLGDASPVIWGGNLYIFTRQGDDEVIRCFDLVTAEEFWVHKYPAIAITGPASSQHPGPRSTPAIGEGKIVTLGVGGVLSCLDAGTGHLLWRNENYTSDLPPFFTSLSPLIFNGMCIVHLGGKEQGEVISFDLKSGKQKWSCPGDAPSYASPALMKIKGKRQIIVLTAKNLVGIEPENGKLLWQSPVPTENRFYNAASPVIDGQTVIITGQGQGTRAVKIEKQGDGFVVVEQWKNSELGTKWNTPVLKDGFLYGLSDGRKLFCMNATNGLTAWIEPRLHNDFGTIVDAGSQLIALPQTSNLVVFKPDPSSYTEIAQIKVSATPTYSYPLLVGDRLIIKDKESITVMTFKQH